jgi:hypothetical protein
VEADVVRQLNLLSLTHRRAAETLRNQFGSSSVVSTSAARLVGDDSDSSSPIETEAGAQSVVDLNDLLASRSLPSADDFQVVGGDYDDDDDDDEDDDEESFVGVRVPPTFLEQALDADGRSSAAPADQTHSMWGSFERLVGKVVQASAKMLAETAGLDATSAIAPRDDVEAELAKLPRKSSSDSLTDEFKEFVDIRESTPDPLSHRGTLFSADPSRSSSPNQPNLLSVNSTGATLSRSDTPSVGCASADDLQLLLRQISEALRRAPDDESMISVNPVVLQNAASAIRNAVSWRRRLSLLQTHNEQLHAAVGQLNVEVLRRAQAARSVTPTAHAMASSALGVSGGSETARLQSEVALLRRQLSNALALTANRSRQQQGSPVKGRARVAKPTVPQTTVTPPPPASATTTTITLSDADAKREAERERTKSVTFKVPNDRDADAADVAPAVTNSFSERSRLTSSEPLLERGSSPVGTDASKTGSETSTPPADRDTSVKQRLFPSEALTSSCDD